MVSENSQPDVTDEASDRRSSKDMRRMCGNTVAFVLATDIAFATDDSAVEALRAEGEDSAICAAIKAAVRAQTAFVYVLCAPSISGEVARVANMMKRKKTDPLVQVLECDLLALAARTAEAGGFSLLGVPFGELEIIAAFSKSDLIEYDGAFVVRSDDAHVTSDDVFDMCQALKKAPQADIVAATRDGRNGLPAVLSSKLLQNIEGLAAGDGSAREDVAGAAVVSHVLLADCG